MAVPLTSELKASCGPSTLLDDSMSTNTNEFDPRTGLSPLPPPPAINEIEMVNKQEPVIGVETLTLLTK